MNAAPLALDTYARLNLCPNLNHLQPNRAQLIGPYGRTPICLHSLFRLTSATQAAGTALGTFYSAFDPDEVLDNSAAQLR